jgi:hypothetical protein
VALVQEHGSGWSFSGGRHRSRFVATREPPHQAGAGRAFGGGEAPGGGRGVHGRLHAPGGRPGHARTRGGGYSTSLSAAVGEEEETRRAGGAGAGGVGTTKARRAGVGPLTLIPPALAVGLLGSEVFWVWAARHGFLSKKN